MVTKIDEKTLPLAIQKDIEALKSYHRGECEPDLSYLGVLINELYGSINGSQWGNEISKEVADYLRAKYMAYDNGVDVEYYFKTHSIYTKGMNQEKQGHEIIDYKNKPYKRVNIDIGVGLNQVDDLKPSEYFYKAVRESRTYDELEKKLKEYYKDKNLKNTQFSQERECDLVAKRIAELLDEDSFSFSVATLQGIHKRLFNEIFSDELQNFVGNFRTYNIYKKEPILNGNSITYGHFEDIENALSYLFKEQKKKDYSKISLNESIKDISEFVADMWQIHPFCEGNTRTTAIFTIKMLRKQGFNINNEIFQEHSKYFRNALVLANYNDVIAGVGFDFSYLESFFKKFLIDKKLELKNMPKNILIKEIKKDENQAERQTTWANKMLTMLGIKTDKSSVSSSTQAQDAQTSTNAATQSDDKTHKPTGPRQ